ncbi:MAG: F0F1 ATP synthase subunit B [Planctomycetaceae bacterium]|nr:F0F1 ATP synthase subunit B [Planctomycetales bacterium]MCB9927223.1 F0F1 ATP synthase subunit B [Planctomycetaceae bacterium]
MSRFVAGVTIVCALLCSARVLADDSAPAATSEVVETDENAEVKASGGESDEHSGAKHATGEHGERSGSHGTVDSQAPGAGHGESEHHDDAHGGHDAHHDSTDLSHMNAGPQLEDPSQFRSDLAIWTFVVFFCLLLILGKFAWGPVMDGLDQREQSIATMIEAAKQGQEKAAEQLKQYEAKLAAAGEEARELVAQARKDAETAKDRILSEAQQAADRQRQRAIEDIQVAKNVALQEMTAKSVDLAVNLAGRIVRQQLNPEDHSQLIRDAMDQLPSRN